MEYNTFQSYDLIRCMPTAVEKVPEGCIGVHESMLRSYAILQKVKELLDVGTPGSVIRELILMMECKL